MRILKEQAVKFIKQEKVGRRTYVYYECFCGATGKTRSDYIHRIKSCSKCQHKSPELIADTNKLWCGKCQSIKDKKDFNIRSDGTKRSCKNCERTYNKLTYPQRRIVGEKWKKNNPERRLFGAAKARAKSNKLDFNIELSDIIIPDVCPVLNIKLDKYSENKNKELSPSLDRIDSNKGYVKGNVQVISWRANWLKNNGTLAEFELLVEHLKKS